MMMSPIRPGDVFGYLTVIRESAEPPYGRRAFMCSCKCGNQTLKLVSQCHLRTGHAASCGCLRKTPRRPDPVERLRERLASLRQDEAGCVIWPWSADGCGYGTVRFRGKSSRAHRASWELHRGLIPPGMVVCHRCDVPACVNIDHLFLGTQADNIADMVAKGRSATGDRSGAKTHPESICRGEQVGRAKLTESVVRSIRARRAMGESAVALAREFGVTDKQIRVIARGAQWRHVA